MGIITRRTGSLTLVFVLTVAAGIVVAPELASAATVCPDMGATSWNNSSGGSWDDPSNWTNGVPGLTCSVSITLAGTYSVAVPNGGGVKTLTLGATSGTQTLQLLGSTTGGGGPQDSIFRADSTVTIGAHGVLQYSATGGNPGGITSTGAGTIVNSGVIRTDLGTGAGTRDIQNSVTNETGGVIALHVGTSTCGCGGTHYWINRGSIITDNGTTSTFTGTANGVQFTQSAGTVTNNGRMEIGGGYIHSGGTTTGNPIEICGSLDSHGAGAAKFEFDSLPDINCGGGGYSVLTGDVGASTSVRIHSDSGGAGTNVAQALTNHGTITIDGGPGQGQLVGQPLTNAGTLHIAPASGAPSTHITSALTNTGMLTVAAHATSDLSSSFTQAGGKVVIGAGATFSANGGMQVAGGTSTVDGMLYVNGDLPITGGLVQGTGTITTTSAVTNTGGTVHPGHSPGILSITGNYVQGKHGKLAIDVAGLSPGSGFSRLAVSGTASLAGAVHVTTSHPETGKLRILTSSARTGKFTSKSFTGQVWTISYDGTGVFLKGTTPPKMTTRPTIRGTVAVGKTLTATTWTFTGRPTTFAFRWLRCTRTGTRCGLISGATHSIHRVAQADIGHRLRVRVTATNPGGRATATSGPTRIVRSHALPRTKPASPHFSVFRSRSRSSCDGLLHTLPQLSKEQLASHEQGHHGHDRPWPDASSRRLWPRHTSPINRPHPAQAHGTA